MFALALRALLALAPLAPLASALAIPRGKPVPATYAEGYLENYDTYNIRYLALDCEAKHDTKFFEQCCHPMLATENLKDNRAPFCTPSPSASSSAALALPTSTVQPSGDPDCDDAPSSTSADHASVTPAAPPPVNVAPKPTSTSEAKPSPSPSPSSSPAPAPSPSSAPAPAPSPSSSPAPSSGNNNGGLGTTLGQAMDGIATFFYQNGIAGNCGTVHQDTDFVVALETSTYANGAHCGKKVVLMDTATGHVEHATVADSCPTCGTPQDVDMSFALFTAFAASSDGVFNLQWAFEQ